MPLHIFTSNRMEQLVAAQADVVKEPLSTPFKPEIIVVQSKGMQRWLAMELSKSFGVWANCHYPFPNSLVWQMFQAIIPDLPNTSLFAPEVMTWKIMEFLPGLLEKNEFKPLQHYLAGDRDGLKHFQLAVRIADTFDQYTLFRPELILKWEAGMEDDWQAVLWRKLASSEQRQHRGRLKEQFCRQIDEGISAGTDIPTRISVFGISYLPNYHMDIFAALARITDVNLFLLSPTREYWADIVSDKVKARLEAEDRAMHFGGNPLLASLGKLGRDFSDMIIELGDLAVSQQDIYADPGRSSLLTAIQSDILRLCDYEESIDKMPIAQNDPSIQIHSCHGPMREIEVLYDNLIALLERDPNLSPRDIVVMTPDIETYAPFISTVFEEGQEPARKIPYSIADRSLTSEGQIASVFLKILDLPNSRLTAPQVLDILEATPVRRRFNLDDNELEMIRGWIENTKIRWGMNENHRAGRGLPKYRENSWSFGLDRLLLGYAMPDEKGALFNGILPYDEMEGASPRTLGKFVEFIELIAEVFQKLALPKTLNDWKDEFRSVLDRFVAVDDDLSQEFTSVTGILESLTELGATAEFSGKVKLAVVRSWIFTRLAQEQKGSGFLTGAVTFCAMLPMRSIPFRVIALIGMNDGAFPRQSRPTGFDLISRTPRRGDRSLREEDRYLFLESILSARDCLYISYVGQSVKDNSEIPPSVLVSEFLDSIEKGFTVADGQKIEQRLVTKHRLQAFSRDYFNSGSGLFSYSTENFTALREKLATPWKAAAFFTAPLTPPSDEWKDIPLARLLRFFDNPSRFILENRLGIRLEDDIMPLEERESFTLSGLEAYGLKQELLEKCLQSGNPYDVLPVARGRGILPPARHGEAKFKDVVNEVADFATALQEKFDKINNLPALDCDLIIGGFRLSGRLDRIWPDKMIRYRCAKIKAKDLIRAWIEHLVLNEIKQDGYPHETTLMMVDNESTFRKVEDAHNILQSILDLYWEGLTVPLRFFPASSVEYAKKQEWKLDRARIKWQGSFNYPGEGEDPYFKLCFGQDDPFNADFERVSRTLLEPLFLHQK